VRERTGPSPAVGPRSAVEAIAAPPAAVRNQRLQETPRRILVALALLGVLAIATYLVAFRSNRRHLVVAVLPIRVAAQDSSLANLADEATNELITNLAQVSTLRVINTPTMFPYRDSTPQDVARLRGADAVVVSRMRSRGDSLHATAQVVLAESDRAVWAGSFDGTREEVFRMLRGVARAVTEQVRARTSARERV